MSGDPTILGMIDQRLERMETDQKDTARTLFEKIDNICSTTVDLKISDEVMKAKIAFVESLNVRTNELLLTVTMRLDEHVKNLDTHFNPYYSETIPQKLWRKKPEIAAGGTLGTFLAALLYFLLDKFGG
jgi:hypothetical protein